MTARRLNVVAVQRNKQNILLFLKDKQKVLLFVRRAILRPSVFVLLSQRAFVSKTQTPVNICTMEESKIFSEQIATGWLGHPPFPLSICVSVRRF